MSPGNRLGDELWAIGKYSPLYRASWNLFITNRKLSPLQVLAFEYGLDTHFTPLRGMTAVPYTVSNGLCFKYARSVEVSTGMSLFVV